MSIKTKQKIELISLKLCPFVQRSVILLKEKNIDFAVTYISVEDLKAKPDWFLKVSPLGKVPVLKVNDQVLFESAIINEYLDETNPPYLHPADPFVRAQNRAWVEFSGSLFALNYALTIANDEAEFNLKLIELKEKLVKVEEQLQGTFFNGEEIALVDIAYAPLFTRLELINSFYSLNLYENLPKVKTFAYNLINRPSVKDSVVPEFKEIFLESLEGYNGFLAGLIK